MIFAKLIHPLLVRGYSHEMVIAFIRRTRRLAVFRALLLPLFAGVLYIPEIASGAAAPRDAGVLVATARSETIPVPHDDDAADDPAIWIHPTSPELSLILGTDKQGGLYVYNLDGSERAVIARDSKPNNVDVLYGFE